MHPIRFGLVGIALVIALGACGASSQSVRGPHGEAQLITCTESDDCYTQADALCQNGYEIRDSHGDGPRILGHHQREILVECRADSTASGESASAPAGNTREDALVCNAASKYIGEFGAYWAAKSGGRALDELPSARDFIVTCQSMAENVQRCMHAKYRTVHEQACDALLGRLDPFSRNKIDSLFLQLPGDAKPQPAAPGTNL